MITNKQCTAFYVQRKPHTDSADRPNQPYPHLAFSDEIMGKKNQCRKNLGGKF